jgi:hypothetical protein
VNAGSTDQPHPWTALAWTDPVKLVEQYYRFLQAVLDTNREFAVALTSAVASLPKRVRAR